MSKPVIGFIGLGAMGEPMTGHLLAGGFRLPIFLGAAEECGAAMPMVRRCYEHTLRND